MLGECAQMHTDARNAWNVIFHMAGRYDCRERRVRIWAMKRSEFWRWPSLEEHAVDVGNPNSPYYINRYANPGVQYGQVTGIDVEIRRSVMRQHAAALAIQQAILHIESFDLHDLAFACDGGTHRSIALAGAMVMGIYTNGTIQPTSHRTAAACMEHRVEPY